MKSRLESRNFKVSSRSRSYDVLSRLGGFAPRSSSDHTGTSLLLPSATPSDTGQGFQFAYFHDRIWANSRRTGG